MIQLLDRLTNEEKQEIVIVKMDMRTYRQITSNDIEFEPMMGSEKFLGTREHNNFINLLKEA